MSLDPGMVCPLRGQTNEEQECLCRTPFKRVLDRISLLIVVAQGVV
jgi:hypothetical protein